MAVKKSTETEEIHIPELKQGMTRLRIVGTTPLFQNRMSEKVKRTLLVGGGKKTKAERVQIKHNPLDEFRASAEILRTGPTALGLRVTAVKGAMCTAALETAGITKVSAQRLLFMPGDFAALYGVPQIRMDVVRSADINKTPDVRSRAFLPKWGAEIEVRFVVPQLNLRSVATLLVNAGILVGVGDFRQEKGKGSFGAFRVLMDGQDDAEWDDLILNHGRDAQTAALENPKPADDETSELLDFWAHELQQRRAA